jgi:hypothetical protein
MERISNTAKNIRQRRAEARENGDIVQTVLIISIFVVVVLVMMNVLYAAIKTKKDGTVKSVKEATGSTPVSPTAAPIDIPIASVLAVLAIVVVAIGVIMASIWFYRKMVIAKSASSVNVDTWKTLIAKHREIRANWASYELDASKLLDFPLMTDMREPATIALHKALKHALSLEPKDIQSVKFIDAAGSPFARAVNDLDVAFHTAESEARRVVWGRFTNEERKRLATAKNLLSIAMDSAASPSERQMAYKRVFKEIEGLIHIPEQALLALEKTHMLSLAA